MQHLSAENGRVAAWCAKHPVFLAFGLCAFGLAVAAAVWGLGILSSATATVVAALYGVFLGAFLMEYFRINEIVRAVRSIWSALTGIWWLLTFWRA
ncbi:hypothetical protein CTI14_20400 [Methylobacterium radiotolerans]|jgi:hypothetical protein|uniref:hypothetical protein n=1 Tax=Methylobacterium TaxID=407 RepID=UPI0004674852|nr:MULTISPECIES: hypothetical protein [Methylobacterium]KTS03302.1 hypothetical protein SB3_26370 [Methylobacterium radiotolerans]KTS44869.1 hypothetical protein SB2_22685 [Methylobacterium radiotolerans]MDE3745249.1 hypothetical protein [Methylobacterium radiotolerans]ONF46232.1 hypothetical protein RSM1_25660 [Methylobacterium radiotolerans]PJI54039.1 hypothetical protein CTI14_20400 [Methylobacterium radiotolerans]